MTTRFRNRTEAGEVLAGRLGTYSDFPDVVVLALPRGGVPVAAQVADRLNLPLDVFVVRKLGLPGHAELAMGAIASGGVRVLNSEVLHALRVPPDVIEQVAENEGRELERREMEYREGRPPPDVQGRTVILVDDGIATGSSMAAAIAALRKLEAGRIIVATPTIASSTFNELARAADDIVAVIVAEDFFGVGQWYDDFGQTTDEEVRELLHVAHATHATP
ncbi:MAG: phosphoribosyltransferase [Chthoniobacterales bacterium]